MALMDWMNEPEVPLVRGEGVYLRPPRLSDHGAWAALREASRDYLQPFEPTWPEGDLTRAAFKRRLGIYERESELGNALPLFLFCEQSGDLVGAMTLSNIRRGVSEAATLGYWIGERFSGQGYGTRGVRAITRHGFEALGLHRIEAACVPDNIRSRRVLEKSGFRLEGTARAYLKINGVWRDHLLFGLLADDPVG
jgi:[ribosomal protein S5]-alanine N-acetyltransferase